MLTPFLLMTATPEIIAHRGASGDRPEHTIAAYALAIAAGADHIEPDLVMTKDGVLVARHENEISETTDVADHPAFADRRRTQTIDGRAVTGWFTEDFTLAELKTLRARERLPDLRPANTRFDGQETIPTMAEIVALVKATPRPVGLVPEIKHPTHFAAIGLAMEAPLVALLAEAGWDGADDPVFIQSFEVGNLEALDRITDLRLVQLVASDGGPADRELTYAEMITPTGLARIARYADVLGAQVPLILSADGATPLVADSHAVGLEVQAWTVRAENAFLPPDLRRGTDPAARGDMGALVTRLRDAKVDAIFTDHPALAIEALER